MDKQKLKKHKCPKDRLWAIVTPNAPVPGCQICNPATIDHEHILLNPSKIESGWETKGKPFYHDQMGYVQYVKNPWPWNNNE